MKDLLVMVQDALAIAKNLHRSARVSPRQHEKLLEVYSGIYAVEEKLSKVIDDENDVVTDTSTNTPT